MPAVAVMFWSESFPAASAVNVTVAWPKRLVVAVAAGEKLPAPEFGLTEKVTTSPAISAEDASRTVAVTVVLPKFAIVEVLSETTTDEGTCGGKPMVSCALPLIGTEFTVMVAWMVAVELSAAGEAAVKVVVAWPDPSLSTEDTLKEPVSALITENETV